MVNYSQITELQTQGKEFAFCVIVKASGSTPRRAGAKMLVFPDGSFEGTIGGGKMESLVIEEALKSLKSGKPSTLEYQMVDPERGDPGVCGGLMEVYVEPIVSEPTLVVIGAGHVGKAVAELAKWLKFRVIVVDEREGFATPELFPDADTHLKIELSELPEKINISQNTFLVLTTSGVDVDVAGLPSLLNSHAGYIGVIGSRKRWLTTQKKLIENGIEEKLLNRVKSPMGLEIDAETPEEIALSILAEIIMLQRGMDGKQMTITKKNNT